MRLALTLITLVAAAPAAAQVLSVPRAGVMTRLERDDSERAMLGITTSSGGIRDTLGLLVASVTASGPADKAGLMEGDRIQSINGVSLRLKRDDASDPYMQGINQNRLTREMRKVKPGDEVTLEVWGSGRSRTLKVKTVAADALTSATTTRDVWTSSDDRAALGVYLNATGSKRDTIGVFVSEVAEGGPAEKAGIYEGDRLASINGEDLRVAREDAGDPNAASARVDRLQREVQRLKAGDVADLVVVSGGRSRTVHVTTERAGDVKGMDAGFDFGNGANMRTFTIPNGRRGVIVRPQGGTVRVMPRIEMRRDADGAEIRSEIEDSLQGLRSLGPDIRAEIQDNLDRELPRAMDELRERLRALPMKVQVRSAGLRAL